MKTFHVHTLEAGLGACAVAEAAGEELRVVIHQEKPRKAWNKGKLKPLGCCYRHATRKVRMDCARCPECLRESTTAWRQAHPEKLLEYRDRYMGRTQ